MTGQAGAPRLGVLPSWRRLPAAVAAGLVWLATMVWLGTVPGRIRDAHLYRLRTHEGLLWAWVALTLVAIGALLALAQWLSVLAHGNRHTAAKAVVVLRAVTWIVFGVLFLTAIWIEGAWGSECWRTCAPFPTDLASGRGDHAGR